MRLSSAIVIGSMSALAACNLDLPDVAEETTGVGGGNGPTSPSSPSSNGSDSSNGSTSAGPCLIEGGECVAGPPSGWSGPARMQSNCDTPMLIAGTKLKQTTCEYAADPAKCTALVAFASVDEGNGCSEPTESTYQSTTPGVCDVLDATPSGGFAQVGTAFPGDYVYAPCERIGTPPARFDDELQLCASPGSCDDGDVCVAGMAGPRCVWRDGQDACPTDYPVMHDLEHGTAGCDATHNVTDGHCDWTLTFYNKTDCTGVVSLLAGNQCVGGSFTDALSAKAEARSANSCQSYTTTDADLTPVRVCCDG